MRLALVAVLAVLPALAQPDAKFAASAPITLNGTNALQRVQLPFDVYKEARTDLADLRILNGRGEEVPFAFAGNPDVLRQLVPAVVLPIFPVTSMTAPAKGDGAEVTVRTSDGTLVEIKGAARKNSPSPLRAVAYLLDASQVKEPIKSLAFDWTAGPGAQVVKVRVESSDDLKEWSMLGAGPLVRLENEGQVLSQPRVEFAPRTAKYLRVTADIREFELKGVRAEREAKTEEASREVKVVTGTRGPTPGEIVYDLGGAIPVQALRLIPADANDVISTSLLARNSEKEPWRQVAWAPFYKMTVEGVEKQSPPLEIGRLAARYWLAKVPATSAGTPPSLEVTWRGMQVVFVVRGEGPYSAVFGRTVISQAALPVSTIIPDYRRFGEFSLPLATMGPVAKAPPPTAIEQFVAGMNTKKIILWSVLVLGVGLMGFMAWRLTRK